MFPTIEPIPANAETKVFPFALFRKDSIKSERTRAGIFAVMGNRDNVGDRIEAGAFAKTWTEGRHNIVHLWDHGEAETTIPTAAIDDLYEIGKSDLPDEVFQYAPDATGAAVVVRTYVKSHLGDHFLAAVDSGAIKQMSFAYAIPKGKSVDVVEEIKGANVKTRVLKEVKQYDTSDVRWGANGATIAQIKSLYGRRLNPDADFQLIEVFFQQLKSGRRDINFERKTLEMIKAQCDEILKEKSEPDDDKPDAEKAEQELFLFKMAIAKASAIALNA